MKIAKKLLILTWFFTQIAVAAESFYPTDVLQEPTLTAPKAGNVSGEKVQFSLGEASVVTGSLQFSLPINFPQVKSKLLYNIIPSYSHRSGFSEWGMSWSNQLSIVRYSDLGQVDFNKDLYHASKFGFDLSKRHRLVLRQITNQAAIGV